MKIAVISFSEAGAVLALKLRGKLDNITIFCGVKGKSFTGVKTIKTSLSQWTAAHFIKGGAVVFIGAVGIAVRTIAPFIKAKESDPAVVVIDEMGRYIIPLLSGHIGGANRLAEAIARILGGTPVITTATDLNDLFAVDSWAVENGYHIVNPRMIKEVSSTLLAGGTVGLSSDFSITTDLPAGVEIFAGHKVGIEISLSPQPSENTLILLPKCLNLGVGCRKNIPFSTLEETVLKILAENDLPLGAVGAMASVDIKKAEPALIEFSQKHAVPFYTYSKDQLKNLAGDFPHSDFVEKTLGIGNVSQRAAAMLGGNIILPTTKNSGVTLAVSMIEWSVKF